MNQDDTNRGGMSRYGPSTALIIVDVQNDFAHPDGSLFVSGAPRVLPFIADQATAATTAGSIVLRTQDYHPESTPHFAKDGGIWPVHCVADTWGAQFHASIDVEGPVVRKGVGGEDGYSGFTVRDPRTGTETDTELSALLDENGITDVVVIGLATDYCVLATALDSVRHGFASTVLADGIASVDLQPGDGARAIAAMVAADVVVE